MLKKEFQFNWRKNEIKYLGIKLTPTPEKLYKTNFLELLNEVRSELNRLSPRIFSWIGRINTIKMIILPKIIYKFQMIPISLPQVFFKTLKRLISRFIWKYKKPRVKYTTLCKGKGQGGLALPDFKNYYFAAILTRVIEWTKKNNDRNWVVIESTMSGTHLAKVIWIPERFRNLDTNTHIITRHAIKVWDNIHKKENWKHNSPLIPLQGTKFFAPGEEKELGKWIEEGEAQLGDIVEKGKIITLAELKQRKENWKINEWRYIQLKHFTLSLPQPLRDINDLRPLEQLCLKDKIINNISNVYKILLTITKERGITLKEKWERDLGPCSNNKQWDKSLQLVHKSAIDTNTEEMNYKLITRWYNTPDKMGRIQVESSRLCWRGCQMVGTIAHIWWECPKIKVFWSEVIELISKITKIDIPLDPWKCMFHGTHMSVKQYKKTLLPHLLNSAKSLIPFNWQKEEAPSRKDWLLKVEKIRKLEQLRTWEEEEQGNEEEIWDEWQEFKDTREYREIIGVE